MSARNVKKQRDEAMKLLRELVEISKQPQGSLLRFASLAATARNWLRRFEVEEQKKQAHTQRNGVKK